jgi:hypothetical protein
MAGALVASGAAVEVISCYQPSDCPPDTSTLWKEITPASPVLPTRWLSLSLAVLYQTRFYARWVGAAVRLAARMHREQPFDLVYSRSLPMSAHVAGYWCARKLRVPWIANINDPWDEHLFPERRLVKKDAVHVLLSKMWLKRTLRTADLVTCPSERLHLYNTGLAGLKCEVEIIPHIGYSLMEENLASASRSHDRFRLVHAGTLEASEGTGYRSAKALLTALRGFFEAHPESRSITELVFVGGVVEQTRELTLKLGLSPFVQWLGKVNYEDSLEHIASASVCILAEANIAEGIYLPSKLTDYLTARKPILALSPSVGVVADMAPRGGIVRVDPNDAGAIQKAIEGFYADFREGTLSRWAPEDELVSQFKAHNVVARFLRAIGRLRGTAGSKAKRILKSMEAGQIGAESLPVEGINEGIAYRGSV